MTQAAPQAPNAFSPAEAYLAATRAVVRQEMAAWQPGCFEYVVVTSYPNGTADLMPNDPTRGLPPVSGVQVWSGLPGGTVQPAVGSHLSLVMLDTRQSKPVVLGAFDTTTATMIQVAANVIQLTAPVIQAGDSSAEPLAKAEWVSALVSALVEFATALSTSVTLANVIASGTTLGTALAALTPAPTTKLLGT